MKTKELIEQLNKLTDEEKEFQIWDWGYEPVENIYIKEVPNGDPANPRCEYIKVVIIE